VKLRKSIVDFCARWGGEHEANYQELLADLAVAREANVLLPKDLPMWRWIRSRLHGEMELIEIETSGWTVVVLPDSLLLEQVGSRYSLLSERARIRPRISEISKRRY